MKIVKGNKIIDLNKDEFTQLKNQFKQIYVDLGCGDGRFIYKTALANLNTLCVGIDPAARQMGVFSKKALRKKLKNVLYAIGSVEIIPNELKHRADKLYIILPWGSLLKTVASPTNDLISNIKNILKSEAELEIIFGYDPLREPTESERLSLEKIDENYIRLNIVPVFKNNNFSLVQFSRITPEDIKQLDSTWGKRIGTTPDRPYFRLSFCIS